MTKILDAKEAISILDEVIKRREDADKTFQTMETQVRRVIMVGTFSGDGPEAIRNHFKYVQLPTIRSFRGFFNVYTKAVKQMKKNILSFESSDALVRRDFWLMQVPKGLHRLQMSTDQSISNVNKVAASIQDIINIGSLNGTAMTMDIKEATRHAQQVHQKLSSLDKTNTALMKAVEAHLNSLGSTVKKAERWASAGPVMPRNYVTEAKAHFEENKLHEFAPKPEGTSGTRGEVGEDGRSSLLDQVANLFFMVSNAADSLKGFKGMNDRLNATMTTGTVSMMLASRLMYDKQANKFIVKTDASNLSPAVRQTLKRMAKNYQARAQTDRVRNAANDFVGSIVNMFTGVASQTSGTAITAISSVLRLFRGSVSDVKASRPVDVSKASSSYEAAHIVAQAEGRTRTKYFPGRKASDMYVQTSEFEWSWSLDDTSMAADFTPVVGNIKSGIEAFTGRDPITGRKLEPWERSLAMAAIIGGPAVKVVSRGSKMAKGGSKAADSVNNIKKASFGSEEKLISHFNKHGSEFKGAYTTSHEYLAGARDVMKHGDKVQYNYRGEIREGYVRFMGSTTRGKSKFEFVGTNQFGEITTYHVESGKTFWRMLNGKNIQEISPVTK
ncbi:T7SS effector LXG polymorphic toxin [Bacillus sp. FSL W7-1360]